MKIEHRVFNLPFSGTTHHLIVIDEIPDGTPVRMVTEEIAATFGCRHQSRGLLFLNVPKIALSISVLLGDVFEAVYGHGEGDHYGIINSVLGRDVSYWRDHHPVIKVNLGMTQPYMAEGCNLRLRDE